LFNRRNKGKYAIGSTGCTIANNLKKKPAMEQAQSSPELDRQLNMKINEFLQNLQLNWQKGLQKDEWFFAKERDKIDNSFTAEEACTELIDVLYLLIRKSDTTEIPKDFVPSLQVLKEKFAKDMYSINILKEI